MTAPRIEINFHELDEIHRQFDAASQQIELALRRVIRVAEELEARGWEGKGAAAFFDELHHVLLPRVRRLIAALNDAGRDTLRIAELLQEAEQHGADAFLRLV